MMYRFLFIPTFLVILMLLVFFSTLVFAGFWLIFFVSFIYLTLGYLFRKRLTVVRESYKIANNEDNLKLFAPSDGKLYYNKKNKCVEVNIGVFNYFGLHGIQNSEVVDFEVMKKKTSIYLKIKSKNVLPGNSKKFV